MTDLFRLAACVLAAGVAASAPSSGSAQLAYPTRPVTIVVPFAAGGGTDTIARRLAQALSGHWKQSVIVENIPGADGLIGTQRVLRSAPDGHLLLMQLNQMLLWKTTLPNARIDIAEDVRLVSKIQHSPLVVVVPAAFPANNLGELFARCRTASTACSWGSATQSGQLAGRQLMEAANLRSAVNVPYKGTTPMITDIVGGHLTLGFVTVAAGAPHVRAGTLKYLAIGSRERFPAAKDVATMAEQGYPVHADTWFGIMVARETPAAVVNAIEAGILSVARDPELLSAIEQSGGAPIFSTARQFQRDVDEESAALAPVVRKYMSPGS